jgi:hypothetical protein
MSPTAQSMIERDDEAEVLVKVGKYPVVAVKPRKR